MNVTISVDDKLLARARKVAQRRGVSLQELLRQMLESLAGVRTADEHAEELMALLRTAPGCSNGGDITRGDAYEGRL